MVPGKEGYYGTTDESTTDQGPAESDEDSSGTDSEAGAVEVVRKPTRSNPGAKAPVITKPFTCSGPKTTFKIHKGALERLNITSAWWGPGVKLVSPLFAGGYIEGTFL